MKVSARLRQVRQHRLDNGKVGVSEHFADAEAAHRILDELAVFSVGIRDKPIVFLTDTKHASNDNLWVSLPQFVLCRE